MLSRAATALAGSLFYSTAVAAQSLPAEVPDILVTGELVPPTERQITAQARNISIIGSPLDEPLPRFQDRVCPGVLGVKEEDAAYIIHRIRHNAEQFKVRLAKDDGKCEPNFIVAFVDNAQGQMAELARKQGYMLAGLSVSERGELLDASRSARVWTNTVIRTNTGAPAPNRGSTNTAPERAFAYDPDTGSQFRLTLPPEVRGSASHSRIYFAHREDIYSVLILFERNRVVGKSLLQLADYATMRGLAFTRETRGEIAADTVLSLFDGDGPKPEQLTSFDIAYLRSLYSGIPNMPAQSKLASVNREFGRIETAASGVGK